NHSGPWPETRTAQTCDQVIHTVCEARRPPGRFNLEQRLRRDEPSVDLRADRKFRGGGEAEEILRFSPGLCRKYRGHNAESACGKGRFPALLRCGRCLPRGLAQFG